MTDNYYDYEKKEYHRKFEEKAKTIINCAEDIYDEITKDNFANIFLTAQYLKTFFDVQYLVDDIDAVKEIFLRDKEGHKELLRATICLNSLNTSDSFFRWNGVDPETMRIAFVVLAEHRAFSLRDELREIGLVKLDNAAETVVSKIFKKDEWGRLDLSRMDEKVEKLIKNFISISKEIAKEIKKTKQKKQQKEKNYRHCR